MILEAAHRRRAVAGAIEAPRVNPLVEAVQVPPIAQAVRWLAAYDGAHGPIVDLSQAVPGHAPAQSFLDRFAELGRTPATARYGEILGDPALRKAYAAHLAGLYGAELTAADVAITAGCNQVFFVAAIAVAGAGSSVILPTPWYFNHQMTLAMLGIEARALPTRAEDGFVPSLPELASRVDATTRAVALVSPNNPTGAIYPPERIAEIHDFCRERGLYLILDETYRDFTAAGGPAPHDLFAQGGWGETLISLYSFSKAYAIPGHRVGAMAAGPQILAAAEKILDSMQICTARPSQAALAPAIAELAAWRRGKVDEILARADVFRAAMAPLADWPVEQIGAFFAYVRHPFADRPSRDVAEALASRLGLLVLPGSFFGPGQERHLRVAFANLGEAGIRTFAERLALAGDLFSPDRTA